LMNKFLHGPTVRLRAAAANGRGLGIVDAVRYLFGLDEASPEDAGSGKANDAREARDRDHHHELR